MCFAPNWTLRFFWLVVVGVNSSCAKETKNQQQENIKRWHFKNDIDKTVYNTCKKSTSSSSQEDFLVAKKEAIPEEDYESGATVESLFVKESNCRLLFSLGVQLEDYPKQECLQQCLDQDSCLSISFKHDDGSNSKSGSSNEHNTDSGTSGDGGIQRSKDVRGGTCKLNTEAKYEAGLFYKCNEAISDGWEYYEKVMDYFQIFNKESGQVLTVKDQTDTEMTSGSGNKTLWFWAGVNIRPKLYPGKLLTVEAVKNVQERTVTLKGNLAKLSQKWSYEDNFLRSYMKTTAPLLLSVREQGKVVAETSDSRFSQHWSLSLEKTYFLITNRGTGTVLNVDSENNGIVNLWSYHGEDNQLFFWDDDVIRSKQFPDKVLQLGSTEGEEASIQNYVHHRYLQHWITRDDDDSLSVKAVTGQPTMKVCAKDFKKLNGTKVVACIRKSDGYDSWSFSSSRIYSFILHKPGGYVMEAHFYRRIFLDYYNNRDRQMWFWDGETIRSKYYTHLVLAIDTKDDNKIVLQTFTGGLNQKWTYKNSFLTSRLEEMRIEWSGGRSRIIGRKTSTPCARWGMTVSHDFFTIWNKHYGTVLDVRSRYLDVINYPYHGQDNQRWFWDENNIRSKKYPRRVLVIKEGSDDRVGVHTAGYDGTTRQNWKYLEQNFVSGFESRKLSVKNYVPGNSNTKVMACSLCTSDEHTYWGYSSENVLEFSLRNKKTKNVLVLAPNKKDIFVEKMRNGDNKYWFWEGSNIRSKANPMCMFTLTLNVFRQRFKLTCEVYKIRPSKNYIQSFAYDKDRYIFPQRDGLLLEEGSSNGKTFIVARLRPGQKPDNKKLEMFIPQEVVEKKKQSCIDKTEAKIYSVIQYIPLISTIWDLGSSIGYAIAKCKDVAQERAISLAIGVVTDFASAVTFGAASAPLQAVKSGIKLGIKFGVKAGIKGSINIAKTSIKSAFKKIVKKGLKSAIKNAVKKSGKLIAKETIIDPALFLKNIGKVSKRVLLHPKKTFKEITDLGKKSIESLRNLKKKLLKEGDICRRMMICSRNLLGTRNTKPSRKCMTNVLEEGKNLSFATNSSGYLGLLENLSKRAGCFRRANRRVVADISKEDLTAAEMLFKMLKEGTEFSDAEIDFVAKRYLQRGRNAQDFLSDTDWLEVKNSLPLATRQNDIEIAEIFAVHMYTANPEVNKFTRAIFYDEAHLKRAIKDFSQDDIDEAIDQAILIQKYLKSNPIKGSVQVYRFEPLSYPDRFEINQIHTEHMFISTTRVNDRTILGAIAGQAKERPREIKITLKDVGSDVQRISAFRDQQEILLPFGTKFRVTKKNVITRNYEDTPVEITEIEMKNVT